MKVGIIGGGGIVGSSAGYALQLSGIVHEIVIVDANPDLADGQALDMLHGTAAIADQVIHAGGYDCGGSQTRAGWRSSTGTSSCSRPSSARSRPTG